MKSFQRPQFALLKKSEGKILSQLSEQDVLLIKSTFSDSELQDLLVYDPALRKWLNIDSALEFKDVDFKFERNVKAPPISATAPAGSAKPPIAAKPSAQPAPPRPAPIVAKEVKPRVVTDEKTEIVYDESEETAEVSMAPVSPAKPVRKMPTPTSQDQVIKKDFMDSLGEKQIPSAGEDLNNPFSSLKKAYNREKLNPDSISLEKNPLIPTDANPLVPRKKPVQNQKWFDISSRKIIVEPIVHIGFRAQIVKVAYPFLMLDRPFEVKPGSTFKAIARYTKQEYKIDVIASTNYPENNVLELIENSDYRFFKDLLIVIGAC